MRIMFVKGPGFDQTVNELGAMGQKISDAADEGMAAGGQIVATNIGRDFLTGQYLKRRTGDLANALQSWQEGEFHIVIGIRPNSAVDHYKYLLGDDTVVIRPKKGKFLAIPIGEALSSSGVIKGKYADGPGAIWDSEKLFIIRSKGQALVGYKRGKRGKFRPLYVLKRSVTVHGTGALVDGYEGNEDVIPNEMQNRINEALN